MGADEEALDADGRADKPGVGVLSDPGSLSVAATDELARIEARAEAARARAARLRQLAEAASSDGDQAGSVETDDAAGSAPSRRRSRLGRWRRLRVPRFRLRRPNRKTLVGVAILACVCASLAASGYLAWHHRDAAQQRQRTAAFAAAARDGIITMLTINSTTARADVQRFADDTTGQFKAGVLLNAEEFVKAAEQSKAISRGSVQAVAVQSMTDDSAVVLVAAKSELTKPGEAKPESRSMRVVVDVQNEGGQLKISRVEFLP
jgi:Mce-associated membrane protein